MIGFLANSIGRWQLKRRFNILNRDAEAINISKMESAILVFSITDEKDYTDILQISTSLKRDEGIGHVTLLAYNSNKEIPVFVDDQLVVVFGDKEVDFSGIPKDEFASKVLQQKFDLMIDFTTDSFLPTDYFLALLNAKTKVGANNNEKGYIFDLLIDIPIESNKLELSKNIIRYLKMINKG